MGMMDPLNAASAAGFVSLLDGIYEHSPWIAERAAGRGPYATLAHLKHTLVQVVREAGREAQLALLRAHPELAGKAMVSRMLTQASSGEQRGAGLTDCTPEEYARLQQLNAAYQARFGWPFILAVRGPRGTGLTRSQVITAFERRLASHPDDEFAECLRQVHRIAELRLADRFGAAPELGNPVWDWAEALAAHTEPGFREAGQLTATYLTEAHRAVAAQLVAWMRECGFDEVSIDAVGNVAGVYHAGSPHPSPLPQAEAVEEQRLLTGSHYDTVRNAGRYDGRLGILVPMAWVRELSRTGRRLPFGIEVVGFAEEEGQRYAATFLASSALVGQFDPRWLDQCDAGGVSMREAMQAAGLPGTMESIAALRRDPARYLGFVEVHIEQGPVLHEVDLPLGVVTSINASVRHVGEARGVASHAGTTPMGRRRDAACAVAELALAVEQRAAAGVHTVGTVGVLEVPQGSINVVPGRCRFSLDLRAPHDEARDGLLRDVLGALQAIGERRGVSFALEETLRVSAAPSHPAWQARWERAIARLGLPVHRLPSGAGHDAMKLHATLPQAMLFVRGEHGGISHNPLESCTSDDIELAVRAFGELVDELAREG